MLPVSFTISGTSARVAGQAPAVDMPDAANLVGTEQEPLAVTATSASTAEGMVQEAFGGALPSTGIR